MCVTVCVCVCVKVFDYEFASLPRSKCTNASATLRSNSSFTNYGRTMDRIFIPTSLPSAQIEIAIFKAKKDTEKN